MTPELIIDQLTAEGIHLSVAESGKLKAAGQPEAVSRWLPILKEHKPRIMAALQSVDPVTLHSGNQITWQDHAGMEQSGVIDFLHSSHPGEMWAFCTLPDGGWCAVNTKYANREEATHE